MTERLDCLGAGLFQPIVGSTYTHQSHPADISDLRDTCRVCGKDIYPEEGDPLYCEEHR